MAENHVEVLLTSMWILAACAVAALVGIAGTAWGVALAAGWLSILVVILGSLVALVAAGSFGFFLWGKQVGYNWHFTP